MTTVLSKYNTLHYTYSKHFCNIRIIPMVRKYNKGIWRPVREPS